MVLGYKTGIPGAAVDDTDHPPLSVVCACAVMVAVPPPLSKAAQIPSPIEQDKFI